MQECGLAEGGMIHLLLMLLFVIPASAQVRELDVTPGTGCIDSGVDLAVGDSVKITATGLLQYANAEQSNGPEGLARAFTDMIRIMPMNDEGRGALIGRIGASDAARPFLLLPTDPTRRAWPAACT